MAEPALIDPTDLDPVLDVETIMLLCLCEAIGTIYERNGFSGFDHESQILDCDLGTDTCCNRVSVTTSRTDRRYGPGWERCTYTFSARITRGPDTACEPKACPPEQHRCRVTAQGAGLRRERAALSAELVREFRCCVEAKIGGRPCLVEIESVRKYCSGLCGGHWVRLRVRI